MLNKDCLYTCMYTTIQKHRKDTLINVCCKLTHLCHVTLILLIIVYKGSFMAEMIVFNSYGFSSVWTNQQTPEIYTINTEPVTTNFQFKLDSEIT